MKTISKISAIALVAIALVGVNTASAATVAELQAMIASLSAQIAALSGTTTTAPAAVSITTNKSSVGGMLKADIVALQNFLIKAGYSIPAGATGTYGPQTTAALAQYQTAKGITPAAGYFGPKTMTSVNGEAAVTTTTTTTTAGITTKGVEGTIVVTKDSSGTKTTVYEGDSNVALLGVKVEAKDSDMSVSRIKVDLGASTDVYNKVFSKIYVTDSSGTVLASKDLTSTNVSREVISSATKYVVTLAGFNSVVTKGTKSTFYVKFDVRSSINNTYRVAQTIQLYPTDAVRALDGAGIDEYAGDASVTANVTVSGALSDNATLTLSTDPSVLKAATNVANDGSASNEKDLVAIGSFRVLAEKDGVLIRDLAVKATTSGSATFPTAYLFDGSTQIASASFVGATSSFTSIDQTIDKDATKTYTVKVDVRNATTTASAITLNGVTVSSAESKTSGNSITVSPMVAVGEAQSFVSKGATTDLASQSIDFVTSKDQNAVTTEGHLTATFNVHIKAIGADAVFTAPTSSFAFKLLKNGSDVSTAASTSVTVYYPATQPTGVTSYTATGFTVPRNAEVTIPVTYKVDVTGSTSVATILPAGNYAVRLNSVIYSGITNDFSSNAAWVTVEKARP